MCLPENCKNVLLYQVADGDLVMKCYSIQHLAVKWIEKSSARISLHCGRLMFYFLLHRPFKSIHFKKKKKEFIWHKNNVDNDITIALVFSSQIHQRNKSCRLLLNAYEL